MKLLSTRNHAEHLGKVPTCILVNPNQVFDSFGQDAVDKYDDLASKGQNSGWMMFKQFLNTEVFIIQYVVLTYSNVFRIHLHLFRCYQPIMSQVKREPNRGFVEFRSPCEREILGLISDSVTLNRYKMVPDVKGVQHKQQL